MQPVDNDMDDLFRRAAEDYPLNTEGADWNKLLQKMEGGNAMPPAKQKGSKRRLLWLLLLLPMFFICNRYSNDNNGSRQLSNQQKSERDFEEKEMGLDQKEPVLKSDDNVADSKKENSVFEDDAHNKPSLNRNQGGNENLISKAKELKNNEVQSSPQLTKNKKSVLLKLKSDISANIKGVGKIKRSKSVTPNLLQEDKTVTVTDKETAADDETIEETADKQDLSKSDESDKEKGNITKAEVAKRDSAETKPVEAKAKPASSFKKLYWGIIGGPDFSMVKSSKVQGVGFGYGLLAGYRITKNLAVETGVLWDKKNYQSDGEYFKTDKAGWPVHTNVIDIAGYCKMFEVPLNIRYDFAAGKNSLWFATAGVSSYFMKRENYYYTVERYGQQYSGSKEYKNSSSNLFSVTNLSVGYQKSVGRVGSLRIEPYVKLPVKGVGIGSLPLRSTGVYFGITRPIR